MLKSHLFIFIEKYFWKVVSLCMHSTIKFSAMRTYLLKLQGALERMINRNQGKAGFKVSASSYNDIIPKIFIHICIW